MRLAGVILAGGRSSRMGGGEKALLDLDGTALIDRVIARLSPQISPVAINANGALEAYRTRGLEVIPDAADDRPGPLAGVLAGMRWAEETGAEAIVTVAGDTPFFPQTLVAQLAAASSPSTPIAMAATREDRLYRHPTFALWPVSLAEALAQALEDGTRKVVAFSDPYGVAEVEFSTHPFDPFFNVNTPDDLAHATTVLTRH